MAERNKQFVREKNLAEMEQKLSEASAIARRCEMSEEEFLKAAQAAFRR